jgi:hypothetical protein
MLANLVGFILVWGKAKQAQPKNKRLEKDL